MSSYRDKLRKRQQQEYEDRNKTGLGRALLLDFSVLGDKKVEIWTPEYGKNEFDILPFVITQAWFKHLRTPSGRPTGLEIGDMWYKLQVPFHSQVGPNNDTWLCLREAFGQECVVCDDMFGFYKDGNKEQGKKLRPRWRTFYNIYDYILGLNFRLFEISYYGFEATTTMDPQRANLLEAQMLDNGDVVVFSDLEEGKTILAEFKKRVLNKSEFPEVTSIEFGDRDPYTTKDLEDVYPLDKMLVIPTPEQVRNSHYGLDQDENNSTEQEQSRTRSRSRNRQEDRPNRSEERSDRQRTTDRSSGSKCPAGGTFGQDCNRLEACKGNSDDSCSEAVFQDCLKVYNNMSEHHEETRQEEPEPEKPQTRTRRTRSRGDEEMSNLQKESEATDKPATRSRTRR